MKRVALWGAVMLCWLGAFGALRTRAEASKLVLVLSARSADAALTEVTARVRGELSAAGFRVLVREPPEATTPLAAVARAGVDLAPSAVLWVVADSTHSALRPQLQIWLSDRLLGKVSMARLSGDPEQPTAPSVLAVHAVELLRARLSELRVAAGTAEEAVTDDRWEEQRPEVAPAPAPVSVAPPPPIASPRERSSDRRKPWFGVSAGAGVLLGSGRLEARVMPLLSGVFSLGEPRAGQVPLAFDLRLSALGFGASERLARQQGSATVNHGLGELAAALRLSTGFALEPWLGVGVGVYTLGVSGRASEPYRGEDLRFWSALGSASLGVRSRPWAHLSLSAAAELLGTLSRGSVRIDEREVARAGGGMWLFRAELTGVF